MRGLVLAGVGEVEYREDLPAPRLEQPSDAVVAVHRAGLCGSDLHPYQGREHVRYGVVPGHEVVGEVTEVGTAVERFRPGDRVVVPFTSSCGRCGPCRRGLSSRCELGALFGYGSPDDLRRPALHGGQAERVRVPLADGTLVGIPDGLDDATAILLADNLPTGWYAAERAEVGAEEVAVVVGLGAVGLCCVLALKALGVATVIAADPVADRRDRAASLGATSVGPEETVAAVAEVAPGGAAAAIDAAGTPGGQELAATLLRPGGTLSVIAVQTADRFAVSPVEAYDRNLTLSLGRAPVRSLLDRLLPQVIDGSLVVPARTIVTHPDVPLQDGPDTYVRFGSREDGLVKALFRP